MFEGPADELTLTENAQPALMAASIAVLRVLEAEAGIDLGAAAGFVAGHSLGEYSALAAARALDLADAARLLKTRGQAMQAAVPVGAGAMAALLGAELDLATAIAEDAADGEVCAVANDNGAGQCVVSGAASVAYWIYSAPDLPRRSVGLMGLTNPVHASILVLATTLPAIRRIGFMLHSPGTGNPRRCRSQPPTSARPARLLSRAPTPGNRR